MAASSEQPPLHNIAGIVAHVGIAAVESCEAAEDVLMVFAFDERICYDVLMEKQCEQCGKAFARRGLRADLARFCSVACKSSASAAVTKTCRVCGAEFRAYGARAFAATFCSRACKGVASRLPMSTCIMCQSDFRPRPGDGCQPTCSRKCGAAYRTRARVTVACQHCGVGVSVTKARLMSGRRLFCSAVHANEWQGQRKVARTCSVCRKAFRTSPSVTRLYCSLACRDADPARRDMLIAMNVMQARLRPNHLERIAYAILDGIGQPYDRQALIGGKFCVDALFQDAMLVVQFDGDYWHGNPAKFPEPDARQRKRMGFDRSQDAYMLACGYMVARFWETDIRRNPEHVRTTLAALLADRQTAAYPRHQDASAAA